MNRLTVIATDDLLMQQNEYSVSVCTVCTGAGQNRHLAVHHAIAIDHGLIGNISFTVVAFIARLLH